MTLLHIRPLPKPRSNLRNRWLWCAAIGLAVITFLVAACGSGNEAKAPDFRLTQFDGSEFRLSGQSEENLVVLNFWYPTCTPCREEMPSFEAAWQLFQAEEVIVEFLGIFVSQGFDSEQDARDFVSELGLTYGFATDIGARVAEMFQIEAYPTTVFIDDSGRVFKTFVSGLDEEELVSMVREMAGGRTGG